MEWADGSHRFCLPLAQLEELQTQCDAGPIVISNRLESGEWRVSDIYQTLRLGLIGGGMAPVDALRLCKAYVLDRPWLENVRPAHAVIQAVLIGKLDEPVGKSQAVGQESDPTA
ncbi:gene transfer agent family protein [Bosea lathyri]|nr:gene transfer agent family protein [Bosea lathyri]